jgi:hypothetical protein
LNRFSGFHSPKPLKRLKFNGLACTQLKQGVNETYRSSCSKSGMRPDLHRILFSPESLFSKSTKAPREGTRPTGNTAILAPL